MKSKSKKPTQSGRSYGLDEKESEASVYGAPIRGFEEDSEYERDAALGMTFENAEAPWTNDGGEENDESSGDNGLDDAVQASSSGKDLRFGGEDISGMSEWSMRARELQLDDGLDAGDFMRSDFEIRSQVEVALNECMAGNDIKVEVKEAEVTLRGHYARKLTKAEIEDLVLGIPGVRDVRNFLEGRVS